MTPSRLVVTLLWIPIVVGSIVGTFRLGLGGVVGVLVGGGVGLIAVVVVAFLAGQLLDD